MVNSILSTKHSPVTTDNKQETTALNYEQGTSGIIQLDGWVKNMKASFQPANNADGTKNALLKMQLEQLNLISPKDFFHYLTKQNVSNIHLLTHDELTDHADNFLIQKAKQAASQNTASVVHEKPFNPSPAVSSYLFQGAAGFFSLWAGFSQKLTAWFVGAKDSKPLETGTKDSHPVPDTTHAPKSQGPQSPTNITLQNTSLPDPSSPGDLDKDHEPANPALVPQETISNDTDAHASLVLRTNKEKILESEEVKKPTSLPESHHNTLITNTPDLQQTLEEHDLF